MWVPNAQQGQGQRIPSNPAEAWLSDGRQVLHFKPVIWDRSQQELEVTSGEWLSDQTAPLLKRRQRLSREKAVELWRKRRSEGWKPCAPQWQPPSRRGWCFGAENEAKPTTLLRFRGQSNACKSRLP